MVKLKAGPDTGVFSTSQAKDEGYDVGSNEKEYERQITLSRGQYASTPQIGIGINAIDLNINMSIKDNIRLAASIRNATNKNFDVRIETWSNSVLNSAGVNWIEAKADAKECQIGEWFPPTKPKAQEETEIKFARPFKNPPNVVVWLKYLDLRYPGEGQYYSIHAMAVDSTTEGATLRLETLENLCYKAGVTWIAFERGKKGVQSGDFAEGSDYFAASRSVNFEEGKFKNPPTILTGINFIHAPRKALPLKLASKAESVTSRGFTWRMERPAYGRENYWDGGKANGDYIALGQ